MKLHNLHSQTPTYLFSFVHIKFNPQGKSHLKTKYVLHRQLTNLEKGNSYTGLDRHLGLQEAEFHDGGMVVGSIRTGRLYLPGYSPGIHFC
jgi:hypothetical protein